MILRSLRDSTPMVSHLKDADICLAPEGNVVYPPTLGDSMIAIRRNKKKKKKTNPSTCDPCRQNNSRAKIAPGMGLVFMNHLPFSRINLPF